VWQVDSTTGAYYYMPGGRLRWMPEDEFYKNKVANLVKASTDLLTRYAAVDHTSHAFKVKHYLGGETAENLLDFVTWAMWKQDDSPMHGVPTILLMDPGAANKGQLMRNFAKRLAIDLRHHAPGAARVTGSVEKAHDLVRMHFETRLRFVDPAQVNMDWLNNLVWRWTAAFCAAKQHSRHGATRYGKWLEIKAEQAKSQYRERVEQLFKKAHSEMDTALADAQKALQKALLEAQKSYDTAVDQVAASTAAKLAALKIQLAEVAAATAALQGAQAAQSLALSSSYTPYMTTTPTTPGSQGFIGPVMPSTTVNINGTNLTNPTATANSVVNAIKYGTVVNTTTLAGIAAASASKSSTSSVNTTTGVSNKLKAMGLL
jgi:hypothetical protein